MASEKLMELKPGELNVISFDMPCRFRIFTRDGGKIELNVYPTQKITIIPPIGSRPRITLEGPRLHQYKEMR